MIILSYNIRGLGSVPSQQTLQNLILNKRLTMILLQETMVDREKAIKLLSNLCSNWAMCAINTIRNFGGLTTIWNPIIFSLKTYRVFSGIVLSSFYKGSTHWVRILNNYAPYSNQKNFWERLDDCGILDLHGIIIVDDLNLTLSP